MEDFKEQVDNIDEIVEAIDIEQINDEAVAMAMAMVKNLSTIYYNEQFMEENPRLKKRIDAELENLRILFKMRKSDEHTHDILLNAITNNPNNASMYRSLSQIQSTLLSIQKQVDETINNITNVLKGYQMEINFARENDNQMTMPTNNDSSIHRGSKSFIEQMKEKNKIVNDFIAVSQVSIFEDEQNDNQEK